jgi:hypothetical protein
MGIQLAAINARMISTRATSAQTNNVFLGVEFIDYAASGGPSYTRAAASCGNHRHTHFEDA